MGQVNVTFQNPSSPSLTPQALACGCDVCSWLHALEVPFLDPPQALNRCNCAHRSPWHQPVPEERNQPLFLDGCCRSRDVAAQIWVITEKRGGSPGFSDPSGDTAARTPRADPWALQGATARSESDQPKLCGSVSIELGQTLAPGPSLAFDSPYFSTSSPALWPPLPAPVADHNLIGLK
ncbi:unnamed protein product [Pleuronectes platessa]|uniref:Uncharacterized protein n=1 Tax=Pleuronectes platessa TaxID=8262 RepID=A0A9N7V7D1_PLEPL|nr:unnamed protein product [Pleuronectes platessa]